MQNCNHSTNTSWFLYLPAEIRLKIYEYAFAVSNDYSTKSLIVLHDRGNIFTTRGQYRALSICPSWLGEDGTSCKLLAVNRRIHMEAETQLFSQHTLFFQNSFNLCRIGDFLDTLSVASRNHIRSVGFEILLFVHIQAAVPKRTLSQYICARKLLETRLPRWNEVIFYLHPDFYSPTSGDTDALVAQHFLESQFRSSSMNVIFLPELPKTGNYGSK